MLRIKLVASPVANKSANRRTVEALGLKRMHQVVEHKDDASVRGMIRKVRHLVQVEEVKE